LIGAKAKACDIGELPERCVHHPLSSGIQCGEDGPYQSCLRNQRSYAT
jgi:hypothetical protein